MQRISVTSSNLRSIGYDPETQILEIEFKKSGTYRYTGVPLERYEGLMAASSKGGYFDSYIKNSYSGRRA